MEATDAKMESPDQGAVESKDVTTGAEGDSSLYGRVIDRADQSKEQDEAVPTWMDDEDSESDVSDMFIFDDEPKPKKNKPKSNGPIVPKPLEPSVETDDHEGYYKFFRHELMAKRYHIVEKLGKGSYATVVRALDTQNDSKVVAIKIIRNNPMMAEKAQDEIKVLEKIREWIQAHPADEQYIVGFHGTFKHRKHICIVFDNMGYNLRDVLDKNKGGYDTGLNIDAVRIFARQLFTSLRIMKDLDLVHGDLKPDNILMNPGPKPEFIKLADFGTTFKHRPHNESEKYDMRGELGSRFYRPPEVMLGIEWGFDMDIWAAGCTLFEIFTGKILFTGRDNNEMLLQQQKTVGHIGRKYYRQGVFWQNYFEDDVHATFHWRRLDENGNTIRTSYSGLGPRTMTEPAAIMAKLKEAAADPKDRTEVAKIERLADLITQCLIPDHRKRIGPHGSLQHPFIIGATKVAPKKATIVKPLFTPSSVGQKGKASAKLAAEKKRQEAMRNTYARDAENNMVREEERKKEAEEKRKQAAEEKKRAAAQEVHPAEVASKKSRFSRAGFKQVQT